MIQAPSESLENVFARQVEDEEDEVTTLFVVVSSPVTYRYRIILSKSGVHTHNCWR